MVINIPDTFNIFGIKIGLYGIVFDCAYITALVITMIRAKRKKLDTDFIMGIFINSIVFGVLGAKMLYIISVGKSMIIYTFWEKLISPNGFVAYGGIILGILSNFLWCIIKKKDFYEYFDIVMPSVAAAQAVGRIGCLLNGCCYGFVDTDMHWYNVMYTRSATVYNNVPYIPIQLVASLGDLSICIILIILSNKFKTKGYTASMYLILYGIGRFIIEFYRADPRGNVGPLSTSQFISIIMIAIAILQFIYCKSREKIKDAIKNKIDNINKNREILKRARARQKEKALKIKRRRNKKHGK